MLYVVSPFESALEARGTRNLKLAALASAAIDVTLITTNFSHQSKRIVHAEKETGDQTYRTVVLGTIPYRANLSIRRALNHWYTAFKIYFYLRGRIVPGDKVVVSTIPPEVLFLISLLPKVFDFYVDVRDTWPDAFPLSGTLRYCFAKYCDLLYRSSLTTARKAFYVAPSFKGWLDRYGFDTNAAFFVPLGYDQSRWVSADRHDPRVDHQFLNLVYVGYLESQFDLTSVIQAVNSTPNVALHVVGSGSRLDQYVRLSTTDRIHFYGALSPSQAASVVASCDLGVLPVVGHAQMPNKLFDYIGARLPVLCIGQCDSAALVAEHNIGFAVSADATADEIRACLDRDLVAKKRDGYDELRVDFSKEAIYPNLVNLMELART